MSEKGSTFNFIGSSILSFIALLALAAGIYAVVNKVVESISSAGIYANKIMEPNLIPTLTITMIIYFLTVWSVPVLFYFLKKNKYEIRKN